MSGFGAARAAAADAASRQQQGMLFKGMSAFDRHKKMVSDLVNFYGAQLPQGGPAAPAKSDYDILRDSFRFIRSEGHFRPPLLTARLCLSLLYLPCSFIRSEGDDANDSWEVRLAKRYYSKLFKEYAIADLSRYKEGKVGLRWRTQREVVSGRGQFVCGAKDCEERRGLASFEVPFAYQEAGERKQALVKVRLCPTHAYQLNYRKHQASEAAAKEERRQRRRRREREERRRSKGSKEKEGRRSKDGGKKRRRHSSSSGSSESESTSSSTSSSSSSSEDEEQRSGGRKRRRRSCGGGSREAQQQSPSQREVGATAAAAVAAAAGEGGPADGEFESFMRGLFE